MGLGAWLLMGLVILYMGFLLIAPITALIKGAFEEGITPVLGSLFSEAFLKSLLLSLEIAILVVGVQTILER